MKRKVTLRERWTDYLEMGSNWGLLEWVIEVVMKTLTLAALSSICYLVWVLGSAAVAGLIASPVKFLYFTPLPVLLGAAWTLRSLSRNQIERTKIEQA